MTETPQQELERLLEEQKADRDAQKGYDLKRATRIKKLEKVIKHDRNNGK